MKRNKYNNIRTKVNDKTCDSKIEAEDYNKLLLCEKVGEISELTFHPKWDAMVIMTHTIKTS